MPRYKAKGVEATLSVADLRNSLSTDLHLTMGKILHSETKRVEQTLSSGREMWEYPIGADGSEKGVYQSIGAYEDMPLYVVEVREERTNRAWLDTEEESVPETKRLGEPDSEGEKDAVYPHKQPQEEQESDEVQQPDVGESADAVAEADSDEEMLDVQQPELQQPARLQQDARPATVDQQPAAATTQARKPLMLRLSNPDSPRRSGHANLDSSPLSSISNIDSSLSSLGDTPSSAGLARPLSRSRHDSLMRSREGSSPPFVQDRPAGKTLPSAYSVWPQADGGHPSSKALVLTIDTSLGSYPGRKAASDQKTAADMKIEIWLNGELVQVHFVNRQRSGPLRNQAFAGTRIHRQVEKPWAYQTAEQAGKSTLTAQQRWKTVGKLLAKQVRARGVSKLGTPPPSAEYLLALSKVAFPERLKDQANFGILDVVITTGKGCKLSPRHGYELCPVPMASTLFKMRIGQVQDETEDSSAEEHTPPPEFAFHNFTSSRALSETPSRKGTSWQGTSSQPRKPAPTPTKADSVGVAKRRASRRIAGEATHLSSDHFLKNPGEGEVASPSKLPVGSYWKKDESEPTCEEAVQSFETPDLCKGSVITYGGPGTQRQITKCRPGEFDENALVVGFRFVVV